MSTQRQKPIVFAAEGLCLAALSIRTAESGLTVKLSCMPRGKAGMIGANNRARGGLP